MADVFGNFTSQITEATLPVPKQTSALHFSNSLSLTKTETEKRTRAHPWTVYNYHQQIERAWKSRGKQNNKIDKRGKKREREMREKDNNSNNGCFVQQS